MQKTKENKETRFVSKKCPNCYTYLSLTADVCHSCHAKVGDVDKLGFATKPVDWKGYFIAVVGVVGFIVYIWWAFFRE